MTVQSKVWLGVIGLSFLFLLATRWPVTRRILVAWLERLWARVEERMSVDAEVDELAEEMYWVLRRQRLSSDIERLRRLIATDSAMSATRQLGNRLAYEWLLRELRDIRHSWPSTPSSATSTGSTRLDSWNVDAYSTPPMAPVSRDWRHSPTVETIEIGWRR
jgi:hypothetical protein